MVPTGSSTPAALRVDLGAAIEARRAADAKAAKPLEIAARADAILRDARAEVTRLEGCNHVRFPAQRALYAAAQGNQGTGRGRPHRRRARI
jgi:hypothetical protein